MTAYSNQDLVDFAYRINKQMGANLETLLKHGVVGMTKETDFNMLLNHLKTNKNFNLLTGFEFNKAKGLIWLDTISLTLKNQFNKG